MEDRVTAAVIETTGCIGIIDSDTKRQVQHQGETRVPGTRSITIDNQQAGCMAGDLQRHQVHFRGNEHLKPLRGNTQIEAAAGFDPVFSLVGIAVLTDFQGANNLDGEGFRRQVKGLVFRT